MAPEVSKKLRAELADAYAERYAMLKQLSELPYPEAAKAE